MFVRSTVVWSGGTLVTTGLLLAIIRLIGFHGRIPTLGQVDALPFYGMAAGLVLIGLVLVLAAPAPRRARSRVRLDEPPVQEQSTLRPGRQGGTPTTHGITRRANHATRADPTPGAGPTDGSSSSDTPAAAPRNAPAAHSRAAASSQTTAAADPGSHGATGPRTQTTQVSASAGRSPAAADPPASGSDGGNGSGPRAATPQTAGMEGAERPAWGTPRHRHPNDIEDEGPRRQEPTHPASGPAAPPPGGPGWDHHTDPAEGLSPDLDGVGLGPDESESRMQARRGRLMERLEELEQKANQAKVRFGLGRVSAAGYRQYLAEVDRERMMIESELMETEE